MPELPEVETVARGLDKHVAGDRIESVWLGEKPEPLKSPAHEIVETLEAVYANREEARRRGEAAARFMLDWTWEKQTGRLLETTEAI